MLGRDEMQGSECSVCSECNAPSLPWISAVGFLGARLRKRGGAVGVTLDGYSIILRIMFHGFQHPGQLVLVRNREPGRRKQVNQTAA